MKHHLTFKDEQSDKFWQIETTGKLFTVTYGKTGSLGVSQTKTFLSEKQCQKEAEKLVNEKLKKGYSVLRKNNNKKSSESINPKGITTSIKSNSPKSAKKQSISKVLINEVQVADDYPFYKNYNSEYVELSNNRILEAQMKKVTIYSREGDKYICDDSLDTDLSVIGRNKNGLEISSWPNDVVLICSAESFYVIDASGKIPSIPKHIPLKGEWEYMSVIKNDNVYFFGDNTKKRGILKLNLKDPQIAKPVLMGVGAARAGLIWQDKFFITHLDGLIVASPLDKFKIVNNKLMSFGGTTIKPIDSNHILILDKSAGAYGRACIIFNIESSPKKVQEIQKKYSAALWVLEDKNLWLFSKKGADSLSCHFSHFTWNGKQFDEQLSVKLSIAGRGYVFRYLHKYGNGFRLIGFKTGSSSSYERIVWDLEIDQ